MALGYKQRGEREESRIGGREQGRGPDEGIALDCGLDWSGGVVMMGDERQILLE